MIIIVIHNLFINFSKKNLFLFFLVFITRSEAIKRIRMTDIGWGGLPFMYPSNEAMKYLHHTKVRQVNAKET